MKHERPSLPTFLNTEKRVEIATRNGAVVTNFGMFGNAVTVEWLIYILNGNKNEEENGEIKL